MDDVDKTKKQLLDEIEEMKKYISELERKQGQDVGMEQRISESEDRYKELVEKSQIGIFIDDKEGNFVYCNDRIPEIFDKPLDEIMAEPPMIHLHPDDYKMVKKYHEERMAGGDPPSRFEVRAFRKDASVVYLEVAVVVLRKGDEVAGTMAYIWDITDRKMAESELRMAKDQVEREKAQWEELEAALKASEEQYRRLVEESRMGIFIDDRDGDFIYCNEVVPEMFQLSMEEFISQHPSERILPEDWEKMKKFHSARVNGEEGVPSSYEIRARRKDNSIIDIEISVVALEENGKIKGTMSYIRDITERKKEEEELRQARDELEKVVEERTRELKVANYTLARDLDKRQRVEKALRESEDYYYRIIETLHDTLLIFDPEGEIILEANQRACEMYGYPKEELVGMSLASMIKDVSGGKDKIITTLKQGHYNNFETVQFRKDGTELFLEVNASVVDYKGKKVIVTILRDKTKQKEDMECMKKSEEEYRMIIQRASDGILVIQDEVVKFVNPKLAQIADTKAKDMIGKNFTDYVHPDEIETLVKNYKRRMAGEVFDSIYKTKLKRANGEFLDAEINASIITFEDKPADLVFVREITNREDEG